MTKDPVKYIEHILTSIHRIELTSAGLRKSTFIDNYEIHDVIIRELEVIGEACRNFENEFRNKYPDIPWSQIVAMRNNLIHEYWDVDLSQVWYTAKHDIPELKESLTSVLSTLDQIDSE